MTESSGFFRFIRVSLIIKELKATRSVLVEVKGEGFCSTDASQNKTAGVKVTYEETEEVSLCCCFCIFKLSPNLMRSLTHLTLTVNVCICLEIDEFILNFF